jgi:hypothetical protein
MLGVARRAPLRGELRSFFHVSVYPNAHIPLATPTRTVHVDNSEAVDEIILFDEILEMTVLWSQRSVEYTQGITTFTFADV